jgi:hypothetical protein
MSRMSQTQGTAFSVPLLVACMIAMTIGVIVVSSLPAVISIAMLGA